MLEAMITETPGAGLATMMLAVAAAAIVQQVRPLFVLITRLPVVTPMLCQCRVSQVNITFHWQQRERFTVEA